VVTRTNKRNASPEFGCSLTQKTKMCSSNHLHQQSFGCSLIQKANMHSQEYSCQWKQHICGVWVLPHLENSKAFEWLLAKAQLNIRQYKLLAHSTIFRVGAFLSGSSPKHAKAPRVTTNSSLDRLFQVGASLTRLYASTKNDAWAATCCTQMPCKLSV